MDKPLIKLGDLAEKDPESYKYYMKIVSVLWEQIKDNQENLELKERISTMPHNEQMIVLMDLIDKGYMIVGIEKTEDDMLFSLEITESGFKKLSGGKNV